MMSIPEPDSDKLDVERVLWYASWVQDNVKVSF